MHFNLDITIIAGFLIANLIVGIYYGTGIKTLKRFAVGDRNFSTTTITGTLIASWIGIGFFTSIISETYKNGLWHIIARVGHFLPSFIVGIIIAPRIKEFFGKITVAEVMHDLYGKKARLITAVCSIALATGYVAVQIKLFSMLFAYFFNIPEIYAAIISSIVIVSYATLGGIFSVTFTDLIQVFTFAVFVPIFALFLWVVFGSSVESINHMLATNPLFDIQQVFNYHDPKFYLYLMLFICFTLPSLDPVMFQRILMAKNTTQVKDAFVYSGILFMIMGVIFCCIGIIALAHDSGMDPNNLLIHVIDNYPFTGLKGLVLIAIMAMGMSSADSYINAAAVIFCHDICQPLQLKWIKNELILARICSVLITGSAIFFIFCTNSFFELLLLTRNFYTPIITVPLILAIFGFRSTPRVVLIGMFSGFITVVLWRIFIQPHLRIYSIIPGIFANVLALFAAHYCLQEPHGWVGIRDPSPLLALRLERKRKLKSLFKQIQNFNVIQALKSNLPVDQATYLVVGIFAIISNYSAMYTLVSDVKQQYNSLYLCLYHSAFICSLAILTFPIWPAKLAKKTVIAIIWNFGLLYLLVFISGILVIISHFDQMQVMIMILNVVLLGFLFSWKSALFMILAGLAAACYVFKLHSHYQVFPKYFTTLPGNIIYFLLLFASALIAFIKPKQQQAERVRNIKNYLEQQNAKMQFDLLQLFMQKEEFVSRLEQQCINVFKSTYKKLNQINRKLLEQNSLTESSSNFKELKKTIGKLNAGAKYLEEVIATVKNKKIINPASTSIIKFIEQVIGTYKLLFTKPVNFIVQFNTKVTDIDIDQSLLEKTIVDLIAYGKKNSNSPDLNLEITDSTIQYQYKFCEQLTRDSLKMELSFEDPTLSDSDVNRLNQKQFNSIDEIKFIDIYKTIHAHYGEINLSIGESIGEMNRLIITINIPVNLDTIRPSSMSLPDQQFEDLTRINILLNQHQLELKRQFAKKLVEAAVDISLISEITDLSKQEINQL